MHTAAAAISRMAKTPPPGHSRLPGGLISLSAFYSYPYTKNKLRAPSTEYRPLLLISTDKQMMYCIHEGYVTRGILRPYAAVTL